jgi:hypothetical protein
MLREIAETPQMKKAAKVAATVIAVISAYDAISDFQAKMAKHEHTIVVVIGVILGLVILIASYATLYLVINMMIFTIAAVVTLLRRIFRWGPKVVNPSTNSKWFVASQVLALALTVGIGIVTHGRIFTVFTYFPDKARKDNYNKIMEQGLRDCLNNPHNQSDVARSLCYEEYRKWE